MPELLLYKKDACPFCQKVTRYLDAHGIVVPTRDTATDPDARAELVRVGGKAQVPCLLIDGEPLYESDDIIAYFAAQGA